jgi:hypothetical protein
MNPRNPVSPGCLWFARFSVMTLPLLVTLVVHLKQTSTWTSPDLLASMGLLGFNYLLFLAMLERKGPVWLGGHLGFGLFLLTAKLFVNTFTILLLIGLQAVRTPVFIPVFFMGYFTLLATSIWSLHRTTL